MSLNKITSSVERKEWMNINCNDIKCATLEADNIILPPIDILEVEKITARGNNYPQINAEAIEATGGDK